MLYIIRIQHCQGTPLIPMKAAHWRMSPKITDFPGLKLPGSEAILPFCFSTVWSIEQAHKRLLLRWCVTSLELATLGLPLR